MKELHRKVVARHPDPESCGDAREGAAEALTGACAGEVLSHETRQIGMPTQLSGAEGNTGDDVNASRRRIPRGRRPSTCAETPCARTGRSQGRRARRWASTAVSGRS